MTHFLFNESVNENKFCCHHFLWIIFPMKMEKQTYISIIKKEQEANNSAFCIHRCHSKIWNENVFIVEMGDSEVAQQMAGNVLHWYNDSPTCCNHPFCCRKTCAFKVWFN